MPILAAALLLAVQAQAAATPPATRAIPAPDPTAIALRVFDEILSRGRFELAKELYAPDFVNHGRTRDVDLAVDQAAARGWREAAPDIVLAPELTVAEGELVAVLWRGTGTNTGSGNGLPATGHRIDGRGITLWRVAEGKVREEWSEFGLLDMLQQVGLAPGGKGLPADARSHAYPPARVGVPEAEREANRRTATRVYTDIVGRGELGLFSSLYAHGYVNHGAHADGGVEAEIEGTKAFRALAPDLAVEVRKTVAQGDLVCVLWTAGGTHTGTALGLKATGKPFQVRGMSVLRLAKGRITDEWSVLDRSSALADLGLPPAPGAPAEEPR